MTGKHGKRCVKWATSKKVTRKRRTLLAFTDTKSEMSRRKTQFKKKGFGNLLVKSEYGAFGLYGSAKAKSTRKGQVRKTARRAKI